MVMSQTHNRLGMWPQPGFYFHSCDGAGSGEQCEAAFLSCSVLLPMLSLPCRAGNSSRWEMPQSHGGVRLCTDRGINIYLQIHTYLHICIKVCVASIYTSIVWMHSIQQAESCRCSTGARELALHERMGRSGWKQQQLHKLASLPKRLLSNCAWTLKHRCGETGGDLPEPFLHCKVLMTGGQKSVSMSAHGLAEPAEYQKKHLQKITSVPWERLSFTEMPACSQYIQKLQAKNIIAGAPWFLPIQMVVPVKEGWMDVPRHQQQHHTDRINFTKVQHTGDTPVVPLTRGMLVGGETPSDLPLTTLTFILFMSLELMMCSGTKLKLLQRPANAWRGSFAPSPAPGSLSLPRPACKDSRTVDSYSHLLLSLCQASKLNWPDISAPLVQVFSLPIFDTMSVKWR